MYHIVGVFSEIDAYPIGFRRKLADKFLQVTNVKPNTALILDICKVGAAVYDRPMILRIVVYQFFCNRS